MEDELKIELEKANKEHLEFLELQDFEILGVDIFKVFAYEIIQIMNHIWLRERLG